MHPSTIAAAFGRLQMNHYSRDDAGRAKHAFDLQIVRQAYKATPRNARRYVWLRERLHVTDVIRVKDHEPTAAPSEVAQIDDLIDKCTAVQKV